MLRIMVLVASVVSFSSCKDKEASQTKTETPTAETSATPEQAPAPPTAVDDALSERCAKALSKVGMDEMMASHGKPSAQEQAIIDGVRKKSQATCESEGLTEEQAACFDAIVDIETLFLSADCPAIAAKQPSWLQMPPPEERKKALDEMKKKREEAAGDKDE